MNRVITISGDVDLENVLDFMSNEGFEYSIKTCFDEVNGLEVGKLYSVSTQQTKVEQFGVCYLLTDDGAWFYLLTGGELYSDYSFLSAKEFSFSQVILGY
jgi:hypothetical protein